jgi:hypothetical protein
MTMDPATIALAALAGVVLLAGLIAYRPLKRWIKKCKRRKGGVYLVKVDHHLNRSRRVNGYVGRTVSFHFRKRQHLGHSRFDPATGVVVKGKAPHGPAMVKVPSQPWSDLNPVWREFRFPWWLCWKWVLDPAETLLILLTWPVYNDAKNHWNPRRITKGLAKAQRATRDSGGMIYRGQVGLAHVGRVALQVAGGLVILVGTYGWMVTR